MIALFIMALIACAYIGWKTTDVVMDLNYQRVMNSLRRDVDLPVRPYAVRFNTREVV